MFGFAAVVVTGLLSAQPAFAPVPDVKIVVLDAGSGPKAVRRFRPETGAVRRELRRTNIETVFSSEGRTLPPRPEPTTVLSTKTTVRDVGTDGRFVVDYTIVSSRSEAGPGVPVDKLATYRSMEHELQGLSGTLRVASSGLVEVATQVPPPGLGPAALERLDGVRETMNKPSCYFPSKPIGRGARWRVVHRSSPAGIAVVSKLDCVLTEESARRLRVEFTASTHSAVAGEAFPGIETDARMKASSSRTEGHMVLDLGSAVPVRQETSTVLTLTLDVHTDVRRFEMIMESRIESEATSNVVVEAREPGEFRLE